MGASPDVVVVGGGLVGCLTARALAKDGLNVRILERGPDLGREASTAAAGMLSPQMEAAEDLLVEVPGPQAGFAMLELCLAAREGYAEFVSGIEAETGLGVGYRADGTLVVALTPVEAGRLRRSAEAQRARGLAARIVEAEEIRRLEPAVTESAVVGLHLPDDHQVDPVRLMAAAVDAVGSAPGIEIETGTAVRALRSEAGHVAGVETDRGSVSAAWVVLAAGAWSGGIQRLPRALPVRPVKGQMAAIRPRQPSIRGIVGGRGAYCVPRDDGRVVVGATVEERGFDATVSRIEVDALVASAADIVPAFSEAEVVSRWAGLRPGTPDSLPIVGPDPGLPGLAYATGHYRNGILLAPLTAACVAAVVTGRPSPHDLAAFAPGRASLTEWGIATRAGS